jgi:hypothetical protein
MYAILDLAHMLTYLYNKLEIAFLRQNVMAEWLAFMIFVWEAYCSDVNLETSYYD